MREPNLQRMQMSITYTKGHETKKANYPKTNTIHETKEN